MEQQVRRQSFPLRLSDSLKREATRLAGEEQVSLNHFIAIAIAEKLSRIEQSQIFERRSVPMSNALKTAPVPMRRALY